MITAFLIPSEQGTMTLLGQEFRVFDTPAEAPKMSQVGLLIAGLLVGFGTALGSGCTSGHGMCGLP